jgi:hypothetical protein
MNPKINIPAIKIKFIKHKIKESPFKKDLKLKFSSCKKVEIKIKKKQDSVFLTKIK